MARPMMPPNGKVAVRFYDPTGVHPEGLSISPVRDLAHCTPKLLRDTLKALENEVLQFPAEEQANARNNMRLYGAALARFLDACCDPKIEDVKAAWQHSGLSVEPNSAASLFGRWLTRVLLSCYFVGVRDAKRAESPAVGVEEFKAMYLQQEEPTDA